jgi:hypothetical protein
MSCTILVTVKLKAQRQLKNEEHILEMCLISVETPFSQERLRSLYPHLHILEGCTTAQYTYFVQL